MGCSLKAPMMHVKAVLRPLSARRGYALRPQVSLKHENMEYIHFNWQLALLLLSSNHCSKRIVIKWLSIHYEEIPPP